MNGARNVKFFLALPPGEGSKGQISFNFKSQFQRFLFQTLCVYSQMKATKHIRRGFLLCRLGHALGVGLGGT